MKPPIHDITDPGEFLPGPTPMWQSWWFWLAIVIATAALGLILFLKLRKQTENQRRESLLDKARERLAKLKSDVEHLNPQTAAVRISLIIRQYLEAAFADPALFETNEEFTLRPHALEKLHPDCRQPVTSHLTGLSRLKYSPKSNTDQIPALIDQAADILAQIELNVSTQETYRNQSTPD